MNRYITKVGDLVPLILRGDNIVDFNLESDICYTGLCDRDDQFVYRKIIGDTFYYHGHNSRLHRFYFGNGLLKQECSRHFCAIFCEDKKVAVSAIWGENYPAEFARFKKMLKEAGYTKDNIIFRNHLEDFITNPMAPTFLDYQEDYQKQMSKDFLTPRKTQIVVDSNSVEEECYTSVMGVTLNGDNIAVNVMTQAC